MAQMASTKCVYDGVADFGVANLPKMLPFSRMATLEDKHI